MTIKELEKKMTELEKLQTETENAHAKLKAQIAELKALREELPEPPHPRWKPNCGQEYFFLGRDGDIGFFKWDGFSVDRNIYDSANVFMSEAEAEFALEKRKVIAEMNEWAGNNYDGAYIYYHRPSDEILIGWSGDSTYCFGSIHFKSADDAENCVKAVGKERLKKYYFGISDKEDN